MSDVHSPIPSVLAAALADRYRVERELGRGGMATVYLAHDLKHERPVAIKVLHEDLGATLGPERFLAEIKTTAKLQHPHILPLLDSGSAAGLLYYVMPFVDGETLRARLIRDQQLPIDDALRIAREVADALAHAHAHGIVHRDIKPENILLQGGHAVVADFGIALAVQSAGGSRMTQTGLSLGTPQYMSPEQAMGDKHVGAAADQYALGAVTYEMLTGDPPFSGNTVQAIVAKVLSERPTSIRVLRDTVSLPLEAAVLRALAKLPADRFAGAAAFGEALASAGSAAALALAAGGTAGAIDPSPANGSTRRGSGSAAGWRAIAIAASLVAIIALSVAVRATTSRVAPHPYDVALPDSAPMALIWTSLDISPVGDFVVYIASRGGGVEIWYRSLIDTTARPIPGTTGVFGLSLSPDGRSVAFVADARLRLASLDGSPVRELGTVSRPEGIAWRSADAVLVGDVDLGLLEFDRLGGPPKKHSARACSGVTPLSPDEVLCGRWKLLLANDSTTLFATRDARGTDDALTELDVSAAEPIDEDHLLYTSPDGSLIGARWNAATGVVGARALVHSGVITESVYGFRQSAVSASGTLVFAPGSSTASGRLVRADGVRPAVVLPIAPLTAGQFDVSPDGRRLAVTKFTTDGLELWVHDLETGQGSRWARAWGLLDPRWSPDSRRLAVLAHNGERPSTLLLTEGRTDRPDSLRGLAVNPNHWFAEHRMLANVGTNTAARLVWVDFSDPSAPRADTVQSALSQQRGVVSPDGRLLVFVAADEIVVQSIASGTRSVVGRGIDPHWLDARTVVFRAGISVWTRVRVDGVGIPTAPAQPWFSDPRFIDTNLRSNAITPRGEMIYVQGSGRSSASFLRVIPRWTAQVRAAVARESR